MAKGKTQMHTPGGNGGRPQGQLDFEPQLWAAADKLRGHMDASEYKHVCLGLIFLKYISDAFEEKREQLLFGFSDPKSEWFIKDEPERKEASENRDEYLAANVFWLPPEARWHTIKAKAKSPEIGKVIDDAMGAIERENPTLKGVLPRDYARPSLDKVRLGGLVDIISNIGFNESAAKSKDVLGRVYEYFLGKFASAEGKGGGEFYTQLMLWCRPRTAQFSTRLQPARLPPQRLSCRHSKCSTHSRKLLLQFSLASSPTSKNPAHSPRCETRYCRSCCRASCARPQKRNVFRLWLNTSDSTMSQDLT
jgi:hypothetical protein